MMWRSVRSGWTQVECSPPFYVLGGNCPSEPAQGRMPSAGMTKLSRYRRPAALVTATGSGPEPRLRGTGLKAFSCSLGRCAPC